mgnify:CR=1 FL=1
MKSHLIGVICLLGISFSYGQMDRLYLKLSYIGGMIVNPGISLGLNYELLGSSVVEETSSKSISALRVGFALDFYHHRRLNTGLSLGPMVEWVRTTPKGFQYGAALSTGYLRTFIPNTFEIKENNQMQRNKFAGTNHFFYGLGLRFGKCLDLDDEKSLEWFVKPNLQFQSPYFEQSNKYFLTEIGVNYSMN